MSYLSPTTRATGTLITSAIWNQDIVDNSKASIPDVFTNAGDLAHATGADALTRLAIGAYAQSLEVNSGATAPAWGGRISGAEANIVLPILVNPATGAVVGANNQVRVLRFPIPIAIVVTSLHAYLSVASAGGVGDLGIFSSDGNTKHFSIGGVSTTSIGVKSATFGAVVLPRGMYWMAWTFDNTTAAWEGQGFAATAGALINGSTTQMGTAANAASTGVLPTTLGSISAAVFAFPIMKVQGS